jgi:hypothetical protein
MLFLHAMRLLAAKTGREPSASSSVAVKVPNYSLWLESCSLFFSGLVKSNDYHLKEENKYLHSLLY